MAEAFGLAPTQAKRELDRDSDLVFEIMRLRAYRRAKQAYDQADPKDMAKLLESPIVQLVKDTDFAIAEEELAARVKQQQEP